MEEVNTNLWLFWVKCTIYCYCANTVKNSRWSWWYHLKVNWLTIILNKSMISRSCGRNYSKGRIVGLYPAAKRQMLQYYTVYLTSYWYGRSSSEQLTCWSSVRTFQTLKKRAITRHKKTYFFEQALQPIINGNTSLPMSYYMMWDYTMTNHNNTLVWFDIML